MICLNRLHLTGFKSIRDLELEVSRLTVLVGANGSGKSNLVSFFRMLNHAMTGALQLYVGESGGADALLHYGTRVTPQMVADLEYDTGAGVNRYHARLVHAAPDTLMFGDEAVAFTRHGRADAATLQSLGAGHKESLLAEAGRQQNKTAAAAYACMRQWQFYQFHDTSPNAYIRKQHYAGDNTYLRSDAGNLAPYLLMLQGMWPEHYRRIVETIRLAAPFFGDFAVQPLAVNPTDVMLNWTERGRDYLFGPHQLSDGTLRFAALATLFLQPEERLPSLIVVDEPELGLHPYALGLLGSMVRSVSQQTQVVLSTQSVPLIDEFEPTDIVVVDRHAGETVCRRLVSAELAEWLEEYSVSELWEKNVIGGRPAR